MSNGRKAALWMLMASLTLTFASIAHAGSDVGKIAFVRLFDGHTQVFIMNGDFINAIRITSMESNCLNPSLSPDGTQIVFQVHSGLTGSLDEIFAVGVDGSGLRQLTDNRFYDGQPVWSPDGRRILYVSRSGGLEEIAVMDADGSNSVQLTHNSFIDMTPSWSPDGNRILFSRSRGFGEGNSIYVMNADGTGIKRLTKVGYSEYSPVWSPDGTRIACCTAFTGVNTPVALLTGGVYVMSADGTGRTRVKGTTALDSHPSWSPDGTKLIFVRNRELHVAFPGQDIDPMKLTAPGEEETDPSWTSVTQSRVEGLSQ